MKKHILFFLILLFHLTLALSQSDFTITAYPVNDELTQNTATCIIQDHKGVIWFSTWDGLNKFDGYNFQNYKAKPGENISLTNNRILHIAEDKLGFIWVICYDGSASRFNPETEKFEQVTHPEGFQCTTVDVFSDNHVWITNGRNSTLRLSIDTLTQKATQDFTFQTEGNPASERIIIYEDGNGDEWIMASESGLYQFDAKGNKNARHIRGSEQQGFYSVYENQTEILFGSDNGEVWHYNKQTHQIHTERIKATSKVKYIKQSGCYTVYVTSLDGFYIQKDREKPIHFPVSYDSGRTPGIRNAYLDRNNLLWIETHSPELLLFDLPTQTFRIVPFRHNARETYNLHVIEDETGNEWIYPYYGGLAYYKNKQVIPFTELSKELSWNATENQYRTFADKQGNLWVSTSRWFGKISPNNSLFHRILFNKTPPIMPENNTFRTLMQDKEGNIWVGNKAGEVLLFNASLQFIGKLTPEGKITPDAKQNTFIGSAYSMLQDHQGRIWIGTKGDGLLCATPNGHKNYRICTFKNNSKEAYSISSNNIYDIYEDQNHRIWFATYEGGLNYLDESNNATPRFINYYNELRNYPLHEANKLYSIVSDTKGNLWIGTSNGVFVFNQQFERPEDIHFTSFRRISGDPNSLSNNNVQNIYCASDGYIYIATFGGGLCKAIEKEGSFRFKTFTVEDGLQTDIIFSIQEDAQQNLWLSGGSGLSRFNLNTEEIEKWDEQQIGFQPLFNEGNAVYSAKGEIIFLTLSGLFHFNPAHITKSDYIPSIIFTQLLLGGKEIHPEENSILPKNLEYMKHIEIPHNENHFTIRYAALDMKHPTSVSYAYRLEGFDREWREADNQRTVTYTNLPTGTYKFHVRSTNGDGVWVNNTRTLEIEILPSFWETPIAWMIYIVTLILIGYIAIRLLTIFYNLRNKVYIEQELTDIKLRFFTDISHELRTPLTLITAPLENLLQTSQLPEFVKEQLTLMKRNADQMLKLVNQILDFRKLQSHKMTLTVEQIEVVSFIERIMLDFKRLAEEQHINFSFIHLPIIKCYLWADADKLEKILFNLLSNAFKFTEAGKHIEIRLSQDENHIYIEVNDEGLGIPQSKLKEIFTRFTSLHNASLLNIPSTGIGLSIVKELVELHKGSISVNSREGEGSCFKVTFKTGKSHYGADTEFVLQDSVSEQKKNEQIEESGQNFENEVSETDSADMPCVLLVEDNSDMRAFLRNIFKDEYRIIEAPDGTEGVKMAQNHLPDIIISDLMMPGMDGVQLVSTLKGFLQTSHIPIILLTAKSAIESKLDAMKEGADDYITKPFSAAYLKARVENLLEQRKKLQIIYRQSLMSTETDKEKEQIAQEYLSEQDRKFMNRLLEVMEQNLDNSELTVETLARNVCMSRSSFFAKVKNLTGLSPIEFIQQMRVKRAAQLIEEDKYSMSEVAAMVGINDSHYFSRYFKKAFSMTPTEYKKKIQLQRQQKEP